MWKQAMCLSSSSQLGTRALDLPELGKSETMDMNQLRSLGGSVPVISYDSYSGCIPTYGGTIVEPLYLVITATAPSGTNHAPNSLQ